MSLRIVVLLITFILVAGCAGETRLRSTSSLVVLNDAFFEDGDIDFSNESSSPRPGVWIEKDGSRICDGYLTNNEGVDFCSATVPKDWKSFTYDGLEYFYQPLSGWFPVQQRCQSGLQSLACHGR